MIAQNPASSALPARPTLIAFGAFILVGGGASVAIRMTYAELAPFWAAASRFALAALVFWGLAYFRKIQIPKGRALLGALVFGTLTVGLAFTLIAWGLVATPASLYQILMAMVPLLTLFLSSSETAGLPIVMVETPISSSIFANFTFSTYVKKTIGV